MCFPPAPSHRRLRNTRARTRVRSLLVRSWFHPLLIPSTLFFCLLVALVSSPAAENTVQEPLHLSILNLVADADAVHVS